MVVAALSAAQTLASEPLPDAAFLEFLADWGNPEAAELLDRQLAEQAEPSAQPDLATQGADVDE